MRQRYQKAIKTVRHTFIKQLNNIKQTAVIVWQTKPKHISAWLIIQLILGILPVVTVTLTRDLVNNLILVPVDRTALLTTITVIAVVASIIISQYFLNILAGWLMAIISQYVGEKTTDMLHLQASRIDMSFMDTSEYYDQMQQATIEAQQRPVNLISNVGTLLSKIVLIIGLIGLLISYSIWLPFIVVLISIPPLWIMHRHTIKTHQWVLDNTRLQRRITYYGGIITQYANAYEVRLFNLFKYFQGKFGHIRSTYRDEYLSLEKQKYIRQAASQLLTWLSVGSIMLWMLLRIANGELTLGDLAVFYQILSRGQSTTNQILNTLSSIQQHSIFMDYFFNFLNKTPDIQQDDAAPTAPQKLVEGIRFNNVTFSYPKNNRIILNNLNLFIPAGKIVAIVGPNGAGKSTLVKLLCRFYDPDGGNITLDGMNIRTMQLNSLREKISAQFQMSMRYQETAAENIRVGDIGKNPTDQEIKQVAKDAGADEIVMRLPNQYDTLLGKIFGEIDISHGEWRRLSLARALLKQKAEIFVLDEPTSALDPWLEMQWLESLPKLVEGKTTIIITHRFTTASVADLICVMKDGEVVEMGNHDELIQQDGMYAHSWHTQSEARHRVIVN